MPEVIIPDCTNCKYMASSVFATCTITKKQLLSDIKSYSFVKKGSAIFQEGDIAEFVFYLNKGKVKTIKKDIKNKSHIISLSKPGDLLGLHSIINATNFNTSAIAIEGSYICVIPKNRFLTLVKEDKEVLMNVMKSLCEDAEITEKRMLGIKHLTVTQRIIEAILLLQQTYGTDQEDFLNISFKDIELHDLVSANKVIVRNIIKKLKQEQVVEIKKDRIKILQLKKLQELFSD